MVNKYTLFGNSYFCRLNKKVNKDMNYVTMKRYLTQDYVHVDVNPVIITAERKVVLAKRKDNVFEGGKWHLPGGRLLVGEKITAALMRIVKLKTGLDICLITNSLIDSLTGVYDDPNRDGREHVIALAYLCKVIDGKKIPGHNVEEVGVFGLGELRKLDIAFDHKILVYDAIDKLNSLSSDANMLEP